MSGNGPRRYRPGRLFHREVVEAANLSLALSRTIVPRLKRLPASLIERISESTPSPAADAGSRKIH